MLQQTLKNKTLRIEKRKPKDKLQPFKSKQSPQSLRAPPNFISIRIKMKEKSTKTCIVRRNP